MASTSRFILLGASALRNPVLVGCSAGFVGATLYSRIAQQSRPILNNAAAAAAPAPLLQQQQQQRAPAASPQKVGLQRYLDYQQLTLGSMAGLLSGYAVGKLSKLLVVLVVAGYLTSQFLVSRGVVVPGSAYLSSTIVQWGRQKISLQNLLDQPSFKGSFLSAFVVAAIYA